MHKLIIDDEFSICCYKHTLIDYIHLLRSSTHPKYQSQVIAFVIYHDKKLSHYQLVDLLTGLAIRVQGAYQISLTIQPSDFIFFQIVNKTIGLAKLRIKPLFIETGSPWENGYIESYNGKMRDELLNGEIFYTLKEARVLIEMWRKEYNTIQPYSALGYQPPVPEAILFPLPNFSRLH